MELRRLREEAMLLNTCAGSINLFCAVFSPLSFCGEKAKQNVCVEVELEPAPIAHTKCLHSGPSAKQALGFLNPRLPCHSSFIAKAQPFSL